ncbi:MAG: hypothetical protein JSR55_04860 [Proteobacteria bacterium]|nr:hypothetical protein [Pseudomonadota bacterium]
MTPKPWFRFFSKWGLPYLILPIHPMGCGLILAFMFGALAWGAFCMFCRGVGLLSDSFVPAVLFLPLLFAYILFMRTVLEHSEKK